MKYLKKFNESKNYNFDLKEINQDIQDICLELSYDDNISSDSLSYDFNKIDPDFSVDVKLFDKILGYEYVEVKIVKLESTRKQLNSIRANWIPFKLESVIEYLERIIDYMSIMLSNEYSINTFLEDHKQFNSINDLNLEDDVKWITLKFYLN